MALGPQGPKQQKALVVIVLALGAAFVFYQYLYTPKMAEVEEVSIRVQTLEDSNQRARVLAARGGGNVEEQLALYERHVMRLERLIPASEEVSSLLRTITAEARRLGVEIGSMEPQPEMAGDFYTKRSYELQTYGEYHDVGRFLTAIASLPRIITPVGLELTRYEDPMDVNDEFESPVLATFQIETYVLPANSGVPAIAAEEMAETEENQ
jgi:type IV pilus assembly protein PilO